MDKNDHISIGMEKLTTSLRKEFDNLYSLSDDCWISKVPPRFRHKDNEILFTPQTVSIGPIHHGKEALKDMEEHKIRCLQCFLQRTEVRMKDFLVLVKEREHKLRDCYTESIKFDSDDFVKMILVDAVFVIELLLRDYIPDLVTCGDRLFRKPNMLEDVMLDLLLLENQLPMFILDDLFTLAKTSTSTHHYEGLTMIKLISEFCTFFMPDIFLTEKVEDLVETHFSKTNHLLDLVRLPLKIPVPPPELDNENNRELDYDIKDPPSATELHQAGVKFQLAGSAKQILDVRFKNGVLEIPKLKMFKTTETLFKNLQVFEQLHCEARYINDYIIFMNCLVNTPKDVELLLRYGVIQNGMETSEEVCELFHSLLNESLPSKNNRYYSDVAEDLHAYWKSPWRNWKANLKQNYFNTPWTAISVAAAIILFVLTFIQTYYAIVKK